MDIDQFDFTLPQHLISQNLPKPRGNSRLLYYNKGFFIDKKFSNILDFIKSGDVLVFNDTKVIPSFLKIYKIDSKEIAASLNLVRKLSSTDWLVMAKPSKKLAVGSVITLSNDDKLQALIKEKDLDENLIKIKFYGEEGSIFEKLIKYGAMPLPPYIKRKSEQLIDFEDYQTVYCDQYGSFAAPTAGLHFTNELIERLKSKGVKIEFLTLHVGLGTFLPIKVQNLDLHKMHSENFSITKKTCDAINYAKSNNNKIIAVGTTVMRALESAATDGLINPVISQTNIFIKPGYRFRIVDALVTNFHLPKSTLLVLVSAFIGIEETKKLYKHAVDNEYKFFSYGDACYLDNYFN